MNVADLVARDAQRVNALEWESTLGTTGMLGGIPMFFVEGTVLPRNGIYSLIFEYTVDTEIELNGQRIVRRWWEGGEHNVKVVRDTPWTPPILFTAGQTIRTKSLIYPEEMA